VKSEWRALIMVVSGVCLFQSCGAWQKLSRASLDVQSQGGKAPLKTADAVPLPPLDPSASTDAPSGAPTTDTPPSAPPEPVPVPPTLVTATGPVVGSTQVTLELGTKRDWVKIQIRRESGSTAPDCVGGVVVGEYSDQSVNPVTFTDQTGSAGQIFSYTACLQDKDDGVLEVSTTASASSKPQIMFTTAPTVRGNLGGSAKAADELCRQFALRSPRIHLRREEHWRAVLSDDHVAAKSRVQILGQIAASDYSLTNSFHTLFMDGDILWNSGLSESSGPILDATGNPTQSPVWTGSNGDGTIQPGLTCQNWSSSLADEFGQTGDASILTGMGWVSGGGPGGCDLQRSLYCIAEPRPLVEARPASGPAGGIELTITPPVGSFGSAYIAIRRRAAAAGLPSLSCDSPFDTPISTVSQLNSPQITIHDDLTAANVAYHYSACLIDEWGRLIYSTRDVYTVASQPTSP
jgi:hypothetical protein